MGCNESGLLGERRNDLTGLVEVLEVDEIVETQDRRGDDRYLGYGKTDQPPLSAQITEMMTQDGLAEDLSETPPEIGQQTDPA